MDQSGSSPNVIDCCGGPTQAPLIPEWLDPVALPQVVPDEEDDMFVMEL